MTPNKIPRIAEKDNIEKHCTRCKKTKSTSDFYHNRTSKDGYSYWCRSCNKEYGDSRKDAAREYAIANKDRISKYQREYKIKNKEKIAKYGAAYRKKNKDKIKKYFESRREEDAARSRVYYKEHIDERRSRAKDYRQTKRGKMMRLKAEQKRRAVKRKSITENFLPSEILERDGYICQHCGRKTRPDFNSHHPLHPNVDHIIPLSCGGSHSKLNTQCLCHRCNVTKNNIGTGDQLRLFG